MNRKQRRTGEAIPYLAEMCSAWEDLWKILRLAHRFESEGNRRAVWTREGAHVNSRDFRDYLRRLPSRPQSIADIGKFDPPTDYPAAERFPAIFNYHRELAHWTLSSRRVFQLSKEVQRVLGQASYSNVTWADARLPFESFAIQLAEPILVAGGVEVEFLLASMREEEQGYVMRIQLVPTTFLKRPAFAGRTDRIAAMLDAREFQAAAAAIRVLDGEIRSAVGPALFGVFGIRWDVAIESSAIFRGENISFDGLLTMAHTGAVQLACRLALGLALYMKSLPASNNLVVKREAKPSTTVTSSRPISNGAELFEVQSRFNLERQVRVVLGLEGSREEQQEARQRLAPHWRRAHFRRRRGEGNDPGAPRVVFVSPTLVNAELLVEGDLPRGASTEIR